MPLKVPGLPCVMLVLMGLFLLSAGVATAVPGLVHDRLNKQFIPVWSWFLGADPVIGVDGGGEVNGAVKALAVVSQWMISATEFGAGVVLIAAAAMPSRRRWLANIGLCTTVGLFGAFMLTMFIMHDKSLPEWNQYPAILAWVAVTWGLVMMPAGWACALSSSEGTSRD